MFLKYVEIRGFKSFPDKTEIVFHSGITAIVGPNGSGKSNISDAVRWVLGEQSVKTLRGGRMEDVIFAGTEFRKPINVCEVSLCFDNSLGKLPIEFNEVLVKRRLYRNGDSEYYINNVQCRLKDVNELFMDTGIGKEGYSIIGQGKIDAILSGKQDERRGIIEEASGIVKFKWRKEETLKKIENYENNLVRLNDIISTYEERLEPLRIESEKAKKFVDLSNELKKKDIDVLVYEMEKIQSALNEALKFLNEKELALDRLKDDKNALKLLFEQLELKQSEIENLFDNDTRDLNACKERINEISISKLILSEKIENLKANIKSLEDEIVSKKDGVENKELLILNEEKERQRINDEYLKTLKEIEDVEDKFNMMDNDKNLNEEKLIEKTSLKDKITSELSKLNGDILNLNSEEKFNKERLLDFFSKEKDLIDKQAKIDEEFKNINFQLEVKNKSMEDLNHDISQSAEKLKKLKYERRNVIDRLNELMRERSKLSGNYQILKNLVEHYEGYNKASKSVMNFAKNKGDAFLTIFGEAIKVKEGMEVAVESSLGGSISDIIVEDEFKAKEYIEYLKNTNSGRITFLPITTLNIYPVKVNKDIESMEGYIGFASDVVTYDIKVKKAVLYYLSKVIVSKDIDCAILIAKKSSFSFKVVTLSGEVVNVGGSLTGGSNLKTSGVLSRKGHIKKLSLEIEEIDKRILSEKEEIEKINILIQDEEKLNEDLNKPLTELNVDIIKLKGKITSLIDEKALALNLFKKNKNDKEKIQLSIEDNKKKILSFKEREEKLLKEKSKLDEEFKLIEISSEDMKKEREKNKDLLMNLKVSSAKYKEMLSSKEELIERINRESIDLNLDIKKLSLKIMSLNDEAGLKSDEILKFEDDINILEKDIKIIKKKLESLEFEKIKFKEESKKKKDLLYEKDDEVLRLERDMHKRELIKIKCETERDNIYLKINDEYGMTYAEILPMSSKVNDVSDMKKDIMRLKEKISSLGVVNVASIEEYKEVSRKYEFMAIQREDMINTKDELNKMILDLTSKMEEIFIENFNILRKNFNETFRELFDGGTGDLILNEDDVLNGNIDINVELPGKKLQNINLMSGGEKGLSAIALLFAILKMKPTAFCLLDEIEASLDDANIIRFATYLKKLKDKTQFVIITHRKGTMEACDSLYGVTMEEKGISKVVSVSLEKI